MAEGNTTSETIAFLAHQREINSHNWYQRCLQLARMARGYPAVYPSALAAQLATPQEDRVYDLNKVERGMVMYFDDPRDSNPYGHIVTVHGHDKSDFLITWTNDARERGAVDLVRYNFFPTHWGDNFQFAAKSLNGFKLDLSGQKPEQVKPLAKKGQDRIKDMIEELDGMIEWHLKRNSAAHDRLANALTRDRNRLKRHLERFKR